MKVLFVASEAAPFAKVGGLGDIIGSLPKALEKSGVKAAVVIPLYESIDRRKWQLKKIGDIAVDGQAVRIFRAGRVFFLENPKYLSRGPIYFDRTAFANSRKEFERFLFFSRAIFEILRLKKFFRPDIVHCHDWHSGALVAMLRNQKSKIPPERLVSFSRAGKNQSLRTVFTIHNLANQGVWQKQNPMSEGIKNADLVITVSPAYAKEILTKMRGEGLQNLLKARAGEKKLIGILNGIDYDIWPFERRDKTGFQKSLKLKQNLTVPIFGLVARLTYQKGIDLIIPNVGVMVRQFGAQFVFLGQGKEIYERALAALAKKYPDNVFTKIGFDETLARHIYAQSDFFLMPSIFEPSGLGQMISMHYGTVPIVRATGGLKDTVRHLKTGFVFKNPTPAALRQRLHEAVDYFFNNPKTLNLMRIEAKKQDFGWGKSALKYKKTYRKITGF